MKYDIQPHMLDQIYQKNEGSKNFIHNNQLKKEVKTQTRPKKVWCGLTINAIGIIAIETLLLVLE